MWLGNISRALLINISLALTAYWYPQLFFRRNATRSTFIFSSHKKNETTTYGLIWRRFFSLHFGWITIAINGTLCELTWASESECEWEERNMNGIFFSLSVQKRRQKNFIHNMANNITKETGNVAIVSWYYKSSQLLSDETENCYIFCLNAMWRCNPFFSPLSKNIKENEEKKPHAIRQRKIFSVRIKSIICNRVLWYCIRYCIGLRQRNVWLWLDFVFTMERYPWTTESWCRISIYMVHS